MGGRVALRLPDPLFAFLGAGGPAMLLTNGIDGFPSAAYAWTVAVDPAILRFVADHGSAALANLERDRRASLQIIAEGFAFLIKGRARPVKPRIEAAGRLEMALWALEVAEVKDQSWPGVRVRPLAYEWSPEHREEMLALERAVYAEMREWKG